MGTKTGPGVLGSFSVAPGPGSYNTGGDINKVGYGVTIGSKYTSSKNNIEVPGPGSYNLKDNKKNGPVIGTSKRKGFGNGESIPGPG